VRISRIQVSGRTLCIDISSVSELRGKIRPQIIRRTDVRTPSEFVTY
jgi:hypothetical protein